MGSFSFVARAGSELVPVLAQAARPLAGSSPALALNEALQYFEPYLVRKRGLKALLTSADA
jgi:hypothetical protein